MTEFSGIGKMMVLAGIGLIIIGGLIWLGGKIPGIGRLPGDIVIKRENFTFYFPIVTCIVISVILSLIMAMFRRH